jgi:hypothetical protein
MPLARLFFFRLADHVGDGYRAGAALGIGQQLSSVRVVTLGSSEEIRNASEAQLLESVQLIPIGGIHAAESYRRIARRHSAAQQRILSFALVWPVLLLLANNNEWVKDNLGTFLGNVAAGLVSAAITLAAPRVIAWFRSATE